MNYFIVLIQSDFTLPTPLKLILLRDTRELHGAEAGGESSYLTRWSYLIQLSILSSVNLFFKWYLGHYSVLFSFALLSSVSFAGCSSQSGVPQISAPIALLFLYFLLGVLF